MSVTFRLVRAGSDPVSFYRWAGSVAAGGQTVEASSVNPAAWFSSRGDYAVEATIDGQAVGAPLTFTLKKPTVTVPKFVDVSLSAGVATTRPDYVCGRWSAGAAWGDIEGDGDPDLYVPHATGASQLFVSNGNGSFSEQASTRGVSNTGVPGIGAVFADYDNDGDQDLYVVNDGPNKLLQNDGSGRFTDVASSAGVADVQSGQSASWGDYNSDGHLDLYVTNYARCDTQSSFTYQLDKLYRNRGDGTFADETSLLEKPPSSTTIGAGFQAAWFDYDSDGDQDLYLGNDFHGNKPDANHFWRNDGPGADGTWQFTDVSVATGTAFKMNTMGIALADYDRDMDIDFALSNIGSTRLLRNNGGSSFTDVGGSAGVARPDQTVTNKAITWGLLFGDLNLDGWEDLYAAGGELKTNPDDQANPTFVATGGGKFVEVTAVTGAGDKSISRGVASADYDRDGLLDIYVVNQDGSPKLFRNRTPVKGKHWIAIDLVGTVSNRDACGAHVQVITRSGQRHLRMMQCGSMGLGSGSETILHFGLGSDSKLKKAVVTWPSGKKQTKRKLAVDRMVTITEPRS